VKKVLIVDDDQDLLEVVKLVLTIHDFDVHTHSTGLNVPEIVNSYNPNAILLDINLPGKSGTEICKELKEKDSSLPIILFSAPTEKEKYFRISGANGYIEKPFNVNELVSTMKFYTN